MFYYQYGGFKGSNSSFNRWDTMMNDQKKPTYADSKVMANVAFIALEKPVVLVLGILPNGASHLLLTETQTRRVCDTHRIPVPPQDQRLFSADYISLSPIEFESSGDLEKKLKRLSPKKRKNGRPADNSQDNGAYVSGSNISVGLTRGLFETSRVMRQVSTNRLRQAAYSTYALRANVKALISHERLPIMALAFTTVDGDDASRHAPTKILEVGWAKAISGVKDLEPTPGASRELIFGMSEDARVKEETKRVFQPFETMDNQKAQIAARVRSFLAVDTPAMIVLVYDWAKTATILRDLGIDTTHWVSGKLIDLIRVDEGSNHRQPDREPRAVDSVDPSYYHSTRRPRRDGRESYYNSSRDSRQSFVSKARSTRSQSPPRRAGSSSTSERPRHDERMASFDQSVHGKESANVTTPCTIHVVDIEQMYAILRALSIPSWALPVLFIAQDLGVVGESPNVEGYSAGWDAEYMLAIWRRMIDGSSIDQAKEIYKARHSERMAHAGTGEESDEYDWDL